MSKEPEDEEFTFDDYDETEDEGLDLPDIEEELGELSEEQPEVEEETEPEVVAEEEKEEESVIEETEAEPEPEPEAEKEPAITAAPAPEEISRDELSLPLSIEVGRVNISMEKLLQLQEGNLLELGVSPESGVDLVVHGKCIGKGELLKVGDNIGIRILQLS